MPLSLKKARVLNKLLEQKNNLIQDWITSYVLSLLEGMNRNKTPTVKDDFTINASEGAKYEIVPNDDKENNDEEVIKKQIHNN